MCVCFVSERESLHVFSVLVAWLFGFGFCYKRLGTIPVTVNLFISDGKQLQKTNKKTNKQTNKTKQKNKNKKTLIFFSCDRIDCS